MIEATDFTLSAEQYEAMAGAPVTLPTQQELLECQIRFWARTELATEDRLRSLAEFVPDTGFFLLAPPRPEPIDFDRLMRIVEVEGKLGKSDLDPADLVDEVATPNGPYLGLDAEDGRARLNVRSDTSKANILAEGRTPYTAFEAVVHAAAFSMVLLHHYLDAAGSLYAGPTRPCVCMISGRPRLNVRWPDLPGPMRGAPSFVVRKGLRA